MEINKILSTLDAELNLVNSPLVNLLNEGLTEAQVTYRLNDLDLTLPQEFYAIYCWKNGTNQKKRTYVGELNLFFGGIFWSLEDGIEFYNAKAGKDDFWPLKMYPIFASGGGQFYLLDLRGGSFSYGSIYYYCIDDSPEEDWLRSVFDSLGSCFTTILEWYKTGVLYYDLSKNAILQCRVENENGIGKRNNPNSGKYWNANVI